MKDSWVQSLYKGRGAAAILSLISLAATSYGVSQSEQQALFDLIVTAAGGVSALAAAAYALISKLRDQKR